MCSCSPSLSSPYHPARSHLYVFFYSCLLLSGPYGPTPSARSLFASVVSSSPGMSHGEEWRFLHVDPSLVVLYYCGQGNTWQYEGGLVLSRERSSPPDHVSLAAEVRACFLFWGRGACRGVCMHCSVFGVGIFRSLHVVFRLLGSQMPSAGLWSFLTIHVSFPVWMARTVSKT